MALTPRQQRFVEEYLVDLNATQAAIRAGYAVSGASVEGVRLLGNAKIAEAVAEARKMQSERVNLRADDVVRELMKIGFSDIRKAVKWYSQTNVAAIDGDADIEALADEVCGGEGSRLYRDGGITELKELGKVRHRARLGYYRPDAPPNM